MGIEPCTNTYQAILATPYGRGICLQNAQAKRKMNEIELIDWAQPTLMRGRKKPAILFSPTSFPPVDPKMGDQVQTGFGHGKVLIAFLRINQIQMLTSLASVLTNYYSQGDGDQREPKTRC